MLEAGQDSAKESKRRKTPVVLVSGQVQKLKAAREGSDIVYSASVEYILHTMPEQSIAAKVSGSATASLTEEEAKDQERAAELRAAVLEAAIASAPGERLGLFSPRRGSSRGGFSFLFGASLRLDVWATCTDAPVIAVGAAWWDGALPADRNSSAGACASAQRPRLLWACASAQRPRLLWRVPVRCDTLTVSGRSAAAGAKPRRRPGAPRRSPEVLEDQTSIAHRDRDLT